MFTTAKQTRPSTAKQTRPSTAKETRSSTAFVSTSRPQTAKETRTTFASTSRPQTAKYTRTIKSLTPFPSNMLDVIQTIKNSHSEVVNLDWTSKLMKPIPIPSGITPYPTYFFEPGKTKDLETPRTILSSVSTKILTTAFPENLFQKMVAILYDIINRDLVTYKTQNNIDNNDICFYFKGGNLYNILLKDALQSIHYDQTEINEYFKRSDADFSIYINPKIYDLHIKQIEVITIYGLQQMRAFMIRENLIDWNNVRNLLNSEKHKAMYNLENIKPINIEPITRSDFMMRMIGSDGVFMETPLLTPSEDQNNNQSPYYITYNDTLYFEINEENVNTFILMRMKCALELQYTDENGVRKTMKVPSELFDISIPKKEDYSCNHFNPASEIQPYRLSYTAKDDTLQTEIILGMNFKYIQNDIVNVFFNQGISPWQDKKYEKRLKRYIFALVIYDFYLKYKEKKAEIKFRINQKYRVSQSRVSQSRLDIEGIMLSEYIKVIENNKSKILEIMNNADNTQRISINYLQNIKNVLSKYNQDKVTDNLQLMIQILETIKQYINPAVIDELNGVLNNFAEAEDKIERSLRSSGIVINHLGGKKK